MPQENTAEPENAPVTRMHIERGAQVVGTDGSLAVPTMRLRTYASKEERSWWKPFKTEVASVERADPLERQLAHFCAVIRGEAKPRVTVRDGLANLRVTEAIAEAARSGQIVAIH